MSNEEIGNKNEGGIFQALTFVFMAACVLQVFYLFLEQYVSVIETIALSGYAPIFIATLITISIALWLPLFQNRIHSWLRKLSTAVIAMTIFTCGIAAHYSWVEATNKAINSSIEFVIRWYAPNFVELTEKVSAARDEMSSDPQALQSHQMQVLPPTKASGE